MGGRRGRRNWAGNIRIRVAVLGSSGRWQTGHRTRGSREEEGHAGFEQGLADKGVRQEDARFGTLSGLRTGSGGDPGW